MKFKKYFQNENGRIDFKNKKDSTFTITRAYHWNDCCLVLSNESLVITVLSFKDFCSNDGNYKIKDYKIITPKNEERKNKLERLIND